MRLKFVTFTGADDKTDYRLMQSLSAKYSFVEWAILFSQSKSGISRYPSYEWVKEATSKLSGVNLSAHLCGKWVDNALKGNLSFLSSDIAPNFGRIQLNMSGFRIQHALDANSLFWDCDFKGRQIIVGGPYSKYNISVPVNEFSIRNMVPLFDCSGGKGVLEKNWPKPVDLLCGYAGGLGPENIAEELQKIEAIVGDAEIWIDMENNIRSDNGQFDFIDFEKCEQVLEIAKQWS